MAGAGPSTFHPGVFDGPFGHWQHLNDGVREANHFAFVVEGVGPDGALIGWHIVKTVLEARSVLVIVCLLQAGGGDIYSVVKRPTVGAMLVE